MTSTVYPVVEKDDLSTLYQVGKSASVLASIHRQIDDHDDENETKSAVDCQIDEDNTTRSALESTNRRVYYENESKTALELTNHDDQKENAIEINPDPELTNHGNQKDNADEIKPALELTHWEIFRMIVAHQLRMGFASVAVGLLSMLLYLVSDRIRVALEMAWVGASSLTVETSVFRETMKGLDVLLSIVSMIISFFVFPLLIPKNAVAQCIDLFIQILVLLLLAGLMLQIHGDVIFPHTLWMWLLATFCGDMAKETIITRRFMSDRWWRRMGRNACWATTYDLTIWLSASYIFVAKTVGENFELEILVLGFVFPLVQCLMRREVAKSFSFWIKSLADKEEGLRVLAAVYTSVETFLVAPGFYVLLGTPSDMAFYTSTCVAMLIECTEVFIYLKGQRILKLSESKSSSLVVITFREQGEKLGLLYAVFIIILRHDFLNLELSFGRVIFALALEYLGGTLKEIVATIILGLNPRKMRLYFTWKQYIIVSVFSILAFAVIEIGDSMTKSFAQ